MKKAVCIFLCAVLAAAALPVTAAYAQQTPGLTLAVASDLHYNLPEETLTFYTDDPVYGHANRRAAMENESGFIIDAFLADASETGADYVLISGDMADHGRSVPEEHYAVRDKLLAFERETGIEVFVIDGNHDLGDNSAVGVAEFKEIYKDLGYDHALSVRADDCSYTADLGAAYRLIALDSCDPSVSTEDGMSADKVSWVIKEAKAAAADGRSPILMMHHNLLDHMPAQRIFSHNFIVRSHLATAELFADAGIKVVFTGHEHCSDAASYTSVLGNVICDFATTSLTMYPLAYRLVTFTPEDISYTSRNIRRIDTSALAAAVKGYPGQTLAGMEADLTAFSKRFLKKGVQYRLSLSLRAEKSGLTPGTPLYGLLDTVYGKLTELLSMPLYGENSASALAAGFGIGIPATPYETGWDLAMEFVAAHYEGGERFDWGGPEVTALLRLASLLLKYVPEGVFDAVYTDAAAKLFGETSPQVLHGVCRRVFGGVRPGELFIAALLSDLVYGFTNDTDIPDNEGSVPGYGQTDRPAAFSAAVAAFFKRLTAAFLRFYGTFGI